MSTKSDLQRIIKRLKLRMDEAERFNKSLKKEIAEIDAKLQRMNQKKKG